MSAALELAGVHKRFDDRPAVVGVSLAVAPGEIYALLGGNGAGKTTTLHLALGLSRPDAGAVRRPGRAAFVPEVVGLYPELTPEETLELFARLARRPAGLDAIEAALTRAGLEPEHHRRRVGALSKGMRQKVALAVAEVQDATLMVLDEPTSGLDPVAADQLVARLVARARAGAAVLASTHDVVGVAQRADRVGILHEGRLVAEADPAKRGAGGLLEMYRDAVRGRAG